VTETEWLTSEDPARMLDWAMGDGSLPGGGPNRKIVAPTSKLRLLVEALRSIYDSRKPDRATIWGPWNPIDAIELPEAARAWSGIGEFAKSLDLPERANFLRDIVGNPFRPWVVAQPKDQKALRGYRVFDLDWLTPQVFSLAQAAYDERNPDGTLDNDRVAVLSDALEEAGCEGLTEEVRVRVTGDNHRWRVMVDDFVPITLFNGATLDGAKRWAENELLAKLEKIGAHSPPLYLGTGRIVRPSPILAHLRSPGPHVSGCWALSLILGKE